LEKDTSREKVSVVVTLADVADAFSDVDRGNDILAVRCALAIVRKVATTAAR
jgi:hypothetical protein